METHLARHSEAKDFMGDDCGKQFKRKDKLKEHGERMHDVLSKKERTIVVLTDHPVRATKMKEVVNPQHLLEEQVTASDVERGTDPGGGQASQYLVEVTN